ncbi:chemotaxis protein CheB [Rhodanobacter sp. MP7CTX1]|uniref:chemotaxis protein CheB n=1 Tax=Rhodanobacter sp. MP7CTX1 TaxID=2723084 RepID=UPI001622E311|nr:chemotaxis protein CheB [Rhodanobacter sp. MP7CTX1]MBB6187431.1 two-component system CheB/CheR fusion protein [Rhodanobacter sp. MP7CTX1]
MPSRIDPAPTTAAIAGRDGSQAKARKRPSANVMIVGIGASAGGLEAFKAFFTHMPADGELAFVLVQHLAPDHHSLLAELVGRSTVMPVLEATHGMRVEPRHVYVIPPNATLTISDGVLQVHKPAPPREHRWPINTFFTSLAEDQGDRAVCVVLAGTGSDGAQGLRAVKDHGGLALAQSGFDHEAMTGMPASAVATGLVDAVLPVVDMPARLLAYQKQMHAAQQQKGSDGLRGDVAAHLKTICELLHTEIGHDFSQYKEKTLLRRIQRRMLVVQAENVTDYIDHLRQHPNEAELLFREFLIGVTEFFRDPVAFETLRTIAIPALLADKTSADVLRVWVPGCATGEEAYSIAILLREAMGSQRGLKVKIFATDIDDQAIGAARAGRFRSPLIGISPERLERWFSKDRDDYCVTKQIREMCIFSPHSVIKDPPFSRMDLVSCRNLLIYLNNDLQERLVQSFHYALRPRGFLLLGTSERLAKNARLFTELDKKQRLYVRRDDVHPRPRGFLGAQPRPANNTEHAEHNAPRHVEDLIDQHARQALEQWSPAYAVINASHDVLRFGGDTGRYLAPSSGTASLNLFQLLDKPLRGAVRAAVLQAFASGKRVIREGLTFLLNGHQRTLRLIVEPLPEDDGRVEMCVVAFHELEPAPHATEPAPDGTPDNELGRIQALEEELRGTRVQLHTAVDLHETASEELKSANEEYQSVNEELQSANEELETSTEEMQSINEELQTVNAELASKNEALNRVNSDIRNLLDSTHIATLFLDRDLLIRSYTPAMTDLFHLRDGDKGRPINEISPRINYPELREDVARVLRDLAVAERTLRGKGDAPTYLLRMRPYLTINNLIDGVVLTFVDITEIQRLNSEHARLAAIVNSSRDAIFGFSLDERITSWNASAERIFGMPAADVVGKPLSLLLPPNPSEDTKKFFVSHERSLRLAEFEMTWVRPNGESVPLSLNYSPVWDFDGTLLAGKLIARDITERVRAARHTELMLAELNHRVKNTLATVQAIAHQTVVNAPDLEAFKESFLARLLALSHTHNLLAKDAWTGAPLSGIINNELAPYRQDTDARVNDARVRLQGDELNLQPKQALALSMALHELATNAGKYGSLSTPVGQVTVTWTTRIRDQRLWLYLAWTETGGPAVEPPTRRGFGSRLIEEGVPYELDGEVTHEFPSSGVICTIDVPLDEVTS